MEHIPPMIDKQGTAEKIRYHMEKNNLKPADLQNYLGLACVQSVYRWLEGVNIPTIDNLYALSQLFMIRIDDMIAGSRRPIDRQLMGSVYAHILVYHEMFRYHYNGRGSGRPIQTAGEQAARWCG